MKKIDGDTKWPVSTGLVGTNVAGYVSIIIIYNNKYALVYSFLLVGLRTPVHSLTCTRTLARTHIFD